MRQKETSQRYIIFSVPLPFLVLISLIRVGQAQVFKPVLSVEPNSPQIFRGDTVTLTCRISGGNGPYHWNKDGGYSHSSAENYYTIKVDQSHKYRCYGSIDVRSTPWSNEVTLSVIERPKAVLTLQPDGQIFSGQEVTFTCEIRGHADTEWMYNWNKDGVQISSYTESRKYSFTAVESLSAKYTCSGRRRSDSQTSETSNTVTLTVSVLSDGKAPLSVLKLLSSAVAASPYVLVTIILAVKCYRARTDPDEDNRPYRVIETEASVSLRCLHYFII
ncbi:B-cell receptor CD22 [Ictalurus punctatus]|uniref:B-cell receptor CD22 n=1 Tax=Ictalurus punctatus TaxID=7998 RepID=A0A9F7RB86_ICTPU|nr:B-cell receptor CD22 [Ictalurus punctatus]